MRKTSLFKRSMAALLCFVLVLGMIPAMSWVAKAAEGDDSEETTQPSAVNPDHITMPITIRDFAADGMLFEYNETGNSGTVLTSDHAAYDVILNPAEFNIGQTSDNTGNLGLRVYTAWDTPIDQIGDGFDAAWWYCILLDASGNVVGVLPCGKSKEAGEDYGYKDAVYADESITYSVWAWRDPMNLENYRVLEEIENWWINTKELEATQGDEFDQSLKSKYRFGLQDLYEDDGTDAYELHIASPYQSMTNLPSGGDNLGLRVTTATTVGGHAYWHCLVCDGDGHVVAVIPSGEGKNKEDNYTAAMAAAGDGAFSVWAWSNDKNRDAYNKISHITEANMNSYWITCKDATTSTSYTEFGNVLYVDKCYNQADTKGFSLLYTRASDINDNINMWEDVGALEKSFLAWNWPAYVTSGTSTTYTGYDDNGTAHTYTFETPSKKFPLWDKDETEYAQQDLYGALIRTNLVYKELDKDGKPIYTPETVKYLAEYMQVVMVKPEQEEDGSFNTFFVTGQKVADGDTLANKIRQQVASKGNKLGTYAASKAKFYDENYKATGNLDEYTEIETWYDAAFFLLHNTWRNSSTTDNGTDGYGMPIEQYHSLHLVAKEVDGKTTYVFNSMYDNSVYSPSTGEIYNTQTITAEQAITNEGKLDDADGNPQPAARFDPLGVHGTGAYLGYGAIYGASPDTYGDMIIPSRNDWNEYYDTTNYHLSLEGHAYFVYHEDADQYFTFTGDDDVYLYINNQRVLDIGGAHSIAKVGIKLNDVAASIGLKDGETYPFDFFYMERHGTAANFGIETNIQIADASMQTDKQGFQGGVNTGYGGPVNAETHVGYTFELENNGESPIYNLTFNDPALDIYFGYDKIRPYPEGEAGGEGTSYPYTIKGDLYLIRYDSEGKIVEYLKPGAVDETILIDRLKAGLAPGEKIGIYGIKYLIPENQWVKDGEEEAFVNTVYTSATNTPGEPTGATKTLTGVADWKVVKMQVPYKAFHVYDWVHKGISNNPTVAETLTWQSPKEAGMPSTNNDGTYGVTVPWDKLKEYWEDEIKKDPTVADKLKNATVVQCIASGNTDEHNQDKHVTVNADNSITYTSDTVGKHTVFFKFRGIAEKYNDLVFSFEVYTYGAVDNIYVLDYGLDVELAGKDFGFYTNDHLHLNENSIEMVPTATDMLNKTDTGFVSIDSKDGTYGTFTWDDGSKSLKYKPDEIIDDTDEVYAKFRIQEKGQERFSIYTGVEMVQKITTAPASVMYYEENFPGITYVNSEKKTLKVDKEGYLLDKAGAQILCDNQPIKLNDEGYLVKKDGNPILHDGKKIKIDIETGKLLDENDAEIAVDDITPVILENKWAHYETLGTDGKTVAGTEQDADQESNYGSDPNYEDNKGGTNDEEKTIVFTANTESPNEAHAQLVSQLAKYLGLAGEDSNGTYNKLEVQATAEVMSFMFKGTGFEIVSRTTKDQYALITVEVYLLDNEGNIVKNPAGENNKPELPTTNADGRVRRKMVITESKGGDLYQVPIIAIKDLQRGQYEVRVTASYHEKQDRVLYIDGIRIYGPLSDDEALEYYSPEESGASYLEVKDLISSYQAVFADLNVDVNDPKIGVGYTLIENISTDKCVLTANNKNGDPVELSDYLSVGPNNEIYLDGNNDTTLIAFFLEPDDTVPVDQRTIQIGAHRKAESLYGSDGNVGMYYGSTVEDAITKTYRHTVSSGTEQYFDIDVKNLELVGGRYLVMIIADEGDDSEVLALTNLKVKGYEVAFLENEMMLANEDGTLGEHALVKTVAGVLGIQFSEDGDGNGSGTEDNTNDEKVNQDLVITTAALQSNSVASGKRATLVISASLDAETIEVLDAQGKVVESTSLASNTMDGEAIFKFMWRVYGTSGEKQVYTVRVKDAEGKYSANTMTVTVTIK